MSKMRSTLMLLLLGATLGACASDPSEPPTTNPPTTNPPTTNPADKLSAILSTPGPAKECLDDLPPPTADMQTTANSACPDSGSACGGGFPYRWCKADGQPAISLCEMGVWVLKAKKCP